MVEWIHWINFTQLFSSFYKKKKKELWGKSHYFARTKSTARQHCLGCVLLVMVFFSAQATLRIISYNLPEMITGERVWIRLFQLLFSFISFASYQMGCGVSFFWPFSHVWEYASHERNRCFWPLKAEWEKWWHSQSLPQEDSTKTHKSIWEHELSSNSPKVKIDTFTRLCR